MHFLFAILFIACNSTEPEKKICRKDSRCDLASFEERNTIFCAVNRGRYDRCIEEGGVPGL